MQEKEPCRVIFKVAKLKTKDIPGYADYCSALEKSLSSWKDNEPVSIYLESIKSHLNQAEIEVLYVIDNGRGFDERRLQAVMAEGSPDKQEGATGSFGVGHLTSYGMSGLQYICYASKQQDDTLLASGHAILASHDSDGELRSNNGYYVQEYHPRFNDPFVFGTSEQIPSFLREELDRIESPSGSIVAILGFNRFRQDSENGAQRKKELHELIREAVAENFAISIWMNHLEVDVFDSPQNSLEAITPERVDQNSIKDFLQHMARPDTGTKTRTVKAQQTLEAIETFQEYSMAGRLASEFADCQIYLRNRASTQSVSVWRNGMLITRSHLGLAKNQFDNKKPFDAVVLLSGKETPRRAHDIVKNAETPMHDKIQEKRLTSKKEKETLKAWLAGVRAWISEYAEESNAELSDLDDEIVFINGSDTMREKALKDLWLGSSMDDGERGPADPNKPGDGETESESREERPKVQRKFSPRKVRAQGRRLPQNRYRIRLKPSTKISKGSLKVIIDSGQDPSCTGIIKDTALVIQSAKSPGQDGKTYEVDSGGLVQLGDLKENETVVVDVDFQEPPDNFDKISLGCLLGSEEDKK